MTGSEVGEVAARLRLRLDGLPASARHRAPFLSAYLRTTEAVGAALDAGLFADADWVRRWDVAFAELYFTAHDADLAGDQAAVSRRGGWPSPLRPGCRRCGTCCWASTPTSTTTCRRRCWR